VRQPPKKPRARSKSKDQRNSNVPVTQELETTDDREEIQQPGQTLDMQSLLANVEPGSLVVFKTAVPNEPGKEMVQVILLERKQFYFKY